MTASSPKKRAAILVVIAVFYASGFAALLYQVVWQRMLALFSGADVFSVTIIVSAFMAGLGLGNFAGGHIADRQTRGGCLALFAGAELAVGVFALLSKALYYDFLYVQLGAAALPAPLLGVVLFAAVAWPTFFMGVSLPLLARGLTPALDEAARTVGSLYGWNTLGAASGALLTTWVLLRSFDFETSLRIGAVINLACAAAVWPLRGVLRAGDGESEGEGPAGAVGDAVPEARRVPLFDVWVWLAVYALSGAVALSLEIAWFRVLGVTLKSTSFTFGTLLAVYLLGVGSGSVVGTRWVRRGEADPALRFLSLQACVPIYAAFSMAVLVVVVGRESGIETLWRYFIATEPLRIDQAAVELLRHPFDVWTRDSPLAMRTRLFAGLYGILPLLMIGPPTFLMGLSFPFLQQAVQTDPRFLGRRVGWLQTANIVGSLVGSLVTGFVLLPTLGSSATFRVLAAFGLVFATLRFVGGSGRARAWAFPLAAAAVASILVVPAPKLLWGRLHGARPARILAAEDAAGLSLIKPRRRGHLLMAGGLYLSGLPYGLDHGGWQTLIGALPVLLHPDPKRIAVIGLGSGDTSYAAGSRAEVEEVITAEIIGSQLTVLDAYQAEHEDPGVEVLLSDPRFEIVVGDGRTMVRRDPRPFDVIEADALRPGSAYAGNLYSLEYYALLKENLAPDGLAVSYLPTPRTRDTFVRAFPYALVLDQIGIGSTSPFPGGVALLLERTRDPHVRAHFDRVGVDIEQLIERYVARFEPEWFGPEHDRSGYTDVNRDLFPKDEFLVPPDES